MFVWRRNSIFRHGCSFARHGKKRKKYNKVQMGVKREARQGQVFNCLSRRGPRWRWYKWNPCLFSLSVKSV